jgi:hypothetical protein
MTRYKPGELYMPSVSIAVGANVALANLGEEDASQRMLHHIEDGDVDTLYFLFKALRFTRDKAVLSAVADSMKDKREVRPICSHCETYFRVCDPAVYAFGDQLGIDLGAKPREFHRYRDEEVAQAYDRVKKWLEAKK